MDVKSNGQLDQKSILSCIIRWCIFIAFIAWFNNGYYNDYKELNALAYQGVTSRVTAISKWRSHGTRGHSYYVAAYFNVSGRRVDTTHIVLESDYNSIYVGKQLTVTYLPTNPSVNRFGRVTSYR